MKRSQDYFSPDYPIARGRFCGAVEAAGGRLESIAVDAEGLGLENLSIDVGWFGPESPRRALLHTCGLHGVEGFAGSAIQLQALDNLPKVGQDTALVFVHVLNPFGMAWLRRFNENNVDLNRNFLAPSEKYEGAPELYPTIDPFLNPTGPPGTDFYHLRIGGLILRHGFSRVKQAVAGGQYEFPKGLFYGGKQLEQGPKKFQSYIAQRLAMVERIFVLDVHTGLGKFGEDTLLVDDRYEALRAFFGERVKPNDAKMGPAYRVRGPMISMIPRTVRNVDAYCLTQEFGTYSPIQVLRALREENQWHQFGRTRVDHPAKVKLKIAFCPEDPSWRQSIVSRGLELLYEALRFLELSSRAQKEQTAISEKPQRAVSP